MWLDQLSRRNFVLAALIATGTLWDHDGLGTPTPYITGRFTDRGQNAYIQDDVYLLQDSPGSSNLPDLDAGGVSPRGYWNGGVSRTDLLYAWCAVGWRAVHALLQGMCLYTTTKHGSTLTLITNPNPKSNQPKPNQKAAYANGRIYLADRIDVVDPPMPPSSNGTVTEVYSPRPAIYWAWVQPTFTAYGPCACYWNFNWGCVSALLGWLRV